ncbi:MAG: hypothetical protein ABFC54_00315 [Thermoguttaceae bacterium]
MDHSPSNPSELPFAEKDRQNGFRLRRFNAKLNALAEQRGLDANAARTFLRQTGLPPFNTVEAAAVRANIAAWVDENKKKAADDLGIDWEGLIEFMEALAPIILEFIEACA